jgi:hypothetical protein
MAQHNLAQVARDCIELLEGQIDKIETKSASTARVHKFASLALKGVGTHLKDRVNDLQPWTTCFDHPQGVDASINNERNNDAERARECFNLICRRARSIDDGLLQRFFEGQER